MNNLSTELAPDLQAIHEARNQVIGKAKKTLPTGMRVGVMLHANQKIPTSATVLHHYLKLSPWGPPHIRITVEIDTAKSCRRTHRDVSLDSIREL